MTAAQHSSSCGGPGGQSTGQNAGARIDVFAWKIQPRPEDARILSADERLRAARAVRREAGARFASGRATVRRILGERLNLPPHAIEFHYGAHGRPMVPQIPDLSFSLSHCGDRALLAIADGIEIGVDLERLRSGLQWRAIAERVLGSREMADLEATGPGDDGARFLELWTVREAYLKSIGFGLDVLNAELPVFLVGNEEKIGWRSARVVVDSDHVASVVWRGPERLIVPRDLDAAAPA